MKDLSGLYDGNWHHLAVSLRFGDPSSAQWVIDGVMRPGEWAKWSGALGGGTDLPPVSTYPLEMGRQLSSSPGYAKCSMDQVRLYHRAMSEIEIADIYNTERSQPQEPEQTTLTMTTPVNQCRTGDYVDFVATLKDSKGNPISGKTIDFTWSYTGLDPAANFAGSWTGTTDLLGQCPLHWFSKWAAFTGNVAATVTAEFDGITGLGPANAAKQLVVIAISARLKGYAFEDCNGNGRIDPDDNMLIGAQITIISPYNNFSYPASGVPVTTGADGSFEAEVNQSGYSVSMPSYNITTTVNPTDFHMEDGSVLTAYAVLRYLPSQVAIVGSVTAHYPEGDVQTVRGATVTLYLANKPEQLKQAIGSTVTGENGLYMLDHIVSGQGYLLVADYSEIDARGLFRNWHGLTGIKSLPQSMIPNYDIQMQETYQRVDCLSDYIGGWSECLRLIDESMKDWKPIGCLSCLEAADDVCKVVKAAKETPDPGDGSKDYLLDDLAALTNLAMDVTVCGANILTACQGSAWDVIAFFTTFKKLDKLADASSCALGLLNDLRNMLGPSTSSAPQEQAFANALNQQSPEGLVGYTSSPVVIMVKDQAGGFLYRDSTRGVVTSSLGFPSWLSTFGDTHEFLYLSRSTADLELEILERQSPQPYDTIFGVTLIRPIGSGRFVCVEFQGVPTFSRTKATLSLADLGPQSRLRLDIDGDGQVDNYIAPFSVSYLTSGYSSLSGFVRKDSTGGLLGMPLDIYDSLGNVWTSVVTDDSGYYHVDSIPNGDYTIAVVTPLGYQADQETKEFTVNHIPVEVNFNLTKLSIAPRQRTRAYWADQLSKVLAGKPKDYTKTQFSRFASLIDQHFNDNRVNPIENYVVPQPATQTDSLKVLSRLLSYQPFASNEPFLKRLGRAELVTLMLNVVSGRVSQTQIVTRDSVTLSQAITYCDMLVNDLECPVGFLPVGFMAEYPRLTDILRYIKACFVAGFINVGITLPAGTIPLDIMDIAYKYAEDGKPLPSDFALGQNYPNPFNPATTIEFTLPVASYVQIEIFNILGQKVRELSSGLLEAGNHTVTWDGADTFGASVSSGIYLYRIHAGDFIDTKKMVLLK